MAQSILFWAISPMERQMKYDYTEVLKDLVRIDTTNPPGNEKMALDYIQQILEQEGINSKIYESAPGRGNLLACLPASFHMDEGAGPDRDSAEDEAADRPLILMSILTWFWPRSPSGSNRPLPRWRRTVISTDAAPWIRSS